MALLNGKNIDPAIFKINTASGNGSTTVFNLTDTPVTLACLTVFVDGLAQVPTTDYSLAGLAVTFVAAPANGQSIMFQYIKR